MDMEGMFNTTWPELDFDSESSSSHSSPSSSNAHEDTQSPPASIWPKEYQHLALGIIPPSIGDHSDPNQINPWDPTPSKRFHDSSNPVLVEQPPLTLNSDFWNPSRSTSDNTLLLSSVANISNGDHLIDPASTILLPKEEPVDERIPSLPPPSDAGDNEDDDDQDRQEMDLDPTPAITTTTNSIRQRQSYPSAATSAPPPPLAIPSTNLVSKDAVISSSIITSLSTPPSSYFLSSATSSSTASLPSVQLLVLGVPTIGAKSRVETQIKISLVLVRPKGGIKIEGGNGFNSGGNWLTDDGGLADAAGDRLERIGSWSHIRLPKWAALKKGKKKPAPTVKHQQQQFQESLSEPPPASTLYLDVAVVRSSEPHDEIFICTGCQQREHKRAQRKKAPGGAGTNGAEEKDKEGEGEEGKRKVVVFNCGELVEFGQGEVVLPTRITCYCRHHKERKGFSVGFSLRTHTGVLVASGATPPIMITDDHKTSVRPTPNVSPKNSTSSFTTPVATPAATPAPSNHKRPLHSAPSSKKSSPVPQGAEEGPVASSSRPKRASARSSSAAKQASAPYDSESRPRKRPSTGGVHKSPSFAMTPLVRAVPGSTATMSAAPSPTSVPPTPSSSMQPQLQQQQDQALFEGWEASALGLVGGMGADSFMNDGSNSAYSTAPSPASVHSYDSHSHSHGWRSAASSPPLSASNSTDNFANFFSGLQQQQQHDAMRSGTVSPLLLHQNVGVLDPIDANSTSSETFASLYTNGAAFASPPATTTRSPVLPPTTTSPWASFPPAPAPPPPPRISRLIPGEGPVHGGIEVTVLGDNFVPNLTCVFGDSAAVPTHYWSSNTLVCILPPSANPGPVVVGIKGVPLTVEQGTGLQLFTYKDDSDRSLLELALQVVGLKMTGRLEDASAVAMRIIGNNNNGGNGAASGGGQTGQPSPTDLAGLALGQATDWAAASSGTSRASSRRASLVQSTPSSPVLTSALNLPGAPGGETRNFEGIVIKFLSLLDLDPSAIPGSAPSVPSARPPISHPNAQRHTLLHLATVLGFHRLAHFLIQRGIDLNYRDRNGFTALHFAALYGRVAITRMLLENNAVAYTKNLAGKTARDIARDRDDVDVDDVFRRLAPSRAPMASNSSAPRSASTPPSFARRNLIPAPPPPSRTASAPSPRSRSRAGATFNLASESEEESEDESDAFAQSSEASFHSSDEDDLVSSDVEPVRPPPSRNGSTISLHYLLEAEEDVRAQYEFTDYDSSSPSLDDSSDEELEADEGDVDESSDFPPEKEELSTIESDDGERPRVSPTTSMRDYASASGAWLANLKPRAVAGSGVVNGVWEKVQANTNAWRPQIQLPIQVQQAFSPKTWYGAREDGGAGSETEGEGGEPKAFKDWVSYGWRMTAPPKSPPPVYSPNDTLLLAGPSAQPEDKEVTPVATTSALVAPRSSTRASVQNKLQRSVGFAPTQAASDSMGQAFVHYEKKMPRLRDDRMLTFFWIPILLVVSFYALYNSRDIWIPIMHTAMDAILPAALRI